MKPSTILMALLCAFIAGCAAPKAPQSSGPIETDYYRRHRQIANEIGKDGFNERLEWARKADAGDPNSALALADMYLTLLFDPVGGMRMYDRAIECGSADAAYEAGMHLLTGAFGLKADAGAALSYYSTALYAPLIEENLTRIRMCVDKALGIALYQFDEPQWADVFFIFERVAELGISIPADEPYGALAALDPEQYAAKATPSSGLPPAMRSKQGILQYYSYLDKHLREDMRYHKEHSDEMLELRAQDLAMDAAYRQQMGQIIAGGMQNLITTVAVGQANVNQARALAQSTANYTPASGPTSLPLGGNSAFATANPPKFSVRRPLSMRESYLQAAEACRQAAAQATNPQDRQRYEQYARENQRNADALLSNAPAVR